MQQIVFINGALLEFPVGKILQSLTVQKPVAIKRGPAHLAIWTEPGKHAVQLATFVKGFANNASSGAIKERFALLLAILIYSFHIRLSTQECNQFTIQLAIFKICLLRQ